MFACPVSSVQCCRRWYRGSSESDGPYSLLENTRPGITLCHCHASFCLHPAPAPGITDGGLVGRPSWQKLVGLYKHWVIAAAGCGVLVLDWLIHGCRAQQSSTWLLPLSWPHSLIMSNEAKLQATIAFRSCCGLHVEFFEEKLNDFNELY